MPILLFACFFLLTAGISLAQRKCSEFVCDNSLVSKAVYLVLNSLVGCAAFFLLAGFRLYVDGKIAFFGFLLSFACVGNVLSGLYALKYCLAASVTSVQNGGSMVILSALGFLLWNEVPTAFRLAAIAVMLIAIYCIFKETKTGNVQEAPLGKRLLFLGLVLLFWVMTTVVNKLFVESCGETHKNSYFFMTNVFMVLYGVVFVAIYCIRHPFPKETVGALIQPKRMVWIAGNTVIGNLQTLVGLMLVSMVEVSVYSTVSTSLAILSGVLVSVILRQKMTKFTYISVVLAIIAVILQAL